MKTCPPAELDIIVKDLFANFPSLDLSDRLKNAEGRGARKYYNPIQIIPTGERDLDLKDSGY